MRIKNAQGEEFEGPDGPVPEGYSMVDTRPTNAQKPPGVLGIPGARYTQPGEQPYSVPNTIDIIKKNWPGILGNIAGSLVPGGPLARAGANALATGGGKALQGDPNAMEAGALAGGGQLVGEGILGGGAAALQGAFRSRIGKQLSAGLADYLREKVPALKDIKNLKSMFLDQVPHDAVHNAYDKSIEVLVDKARLDKDLMIPRGLADTLGLPIKDAAKSSKVAPQPAFSGPGPAPETLVRVNPADAIAGTVGQWKRHPEEYGKMSDILSDAGYGNEEAKLAYKTYSGVKELMNRSGAIEGNKFNPEKAQAALSDIPIADQLLRRGMQQDVSKILLPGGREAIEKGNHKLSGGVLGAGLGALAGGPLGMLGHGGGAIGGAYLGSKIGQAIPRYSNVVPPGLTAAQGPLAAGLGSMATNAMSPFPQEDQSGQAGQ